VEGVWRRQGYGGGHGRFLVGEDGLLYRVFTETDPMPHHPAPMHQLQHRTSQCLRHDDPNLRTAARLRKRFWWAGLYAAVEKQVADCLACRLGKMKRSRRQAKMQVWHLKARFETCYALLRMRPLLNSWAEYSVVISCGKVDYDKSG
jgi:Integrase zinc binding domain